MTAANEFNDLGDKTGPVADWLAGLLKGLWDMVNLLIAKAAAVADRVEVRFERLEARAYLAIGVAIAVFLLHAWIMRPRK